MENQITNTLNNANAFQQAGFSKENADASASINEDSMQRVFDRIDSQFEQINRRIDAFQNDVDRRFDAFQSDVDKRFEQTERRFEQVDKRFNSMQWMIGVSVALLVLIKFFS